MSTCDLCAVGTISIGGATKCTNCTLGKFIDTPGQASCQSCAPGRYSAEVLLFFFFFFSLAPSFVIGPRI
jgi:hypothetical protein